MNESIIILSADGNPDYAFPLPIVAASWLRIGYTPLTFLIGNVPWPTVDALHDIGARVVQLDPVPGYPIKYTGKCIRFFGHHVTDSSDYLITGDADMMMLSTEYMAQVDHDKDVQFWYANAYTGTQWEPRYPLCHIGARAEVWADIIRCPDIDTFLDKYAMYGEEPNGNFSDELIFKEILKMWPGYPTRCQMIEREQVCAMGAKHRIDRHTWPTTRRDVIDAHTPRPAYNGKCWPSLLALVRDYMPDMADRISQYREDYCEVAGLHFG